jgi:glycosyltransferase involved in cell wall biosynthesis
MIVVHLTASRFFGGPERQMLGLARGLPADVRTVIVSFSENGTCAAFLREAQRQGIEAMALKADTPHLLAARRELIDLLHRLRADVICCHGYKGDLIGRWAARSVGIPAVAVSRGWTAESFRVRLYEFLDRRVLRGMDRVVCVSQGQAAKVKKAGVAAERIRVIPNSIDTQRFDQPDAEAPEMLQQYFPTRRRFIIGAAGRLSPEKGFEQLIRAAPKVLAAVPNAGFVIFGDGPLRCNLQQQIAELALQADFVLAGFREDLDRLVSGLDLLVLPSFTEGMPNVVLEAMAASVTVVATAVGGTPEVVADGITGWLVPPGNPPELARRIIDVLSDSERETMGRRGRQHVEEHFTFAAQAQKYLELFNECVRRPRHGDANSTSETVPDSSDLVFSDRS